MDLWQRKPTSPSGCALVLGWFTAINPRRPGYNYYLFCLKYSRINLEGGQTKPKALRCSKELSYKERGDLQESLECSVSTLDYVILFNFTFL